MALDKGGDYLTRLVRMFNKTHGYAGMFNYENSDDKRRVEEIVIDEWRRSAKAEFGVELESVWHNPSDPPDFFARTGDRQINIELVQMVEEEHKARAAKDENPHVGKLFLDMKWSRSRLRTKLHDIVHKKGEKYRKRGLEIDLLLIYTAENWLTSNSARTWLVGAEMEIHPNIHTVHLLIDYEPGRGVDHWPLLTVYGDLSFSSHGN